MTGTKDDRDMTGVLYGGVREKRAGKHIITTTHQDYHARQYRLPPKLRPKLIKSNPS